MFNLVSKRYMFLLISLIVIVPGVISLGDFPSQRWHRLCRWCYRRDPPQHSTISTTKHHKSLKPLKLANLQVLTGNNTNLPADQVVWLRLNTQVDTNVHELHCHYPQAKYGSQLAVQRR